MIFVSNIQHNRTFRKKITVKIAILSATSITIKITINDSVLLWCLRVDYLRRKSSKTIYYFSPNTLHSLSFYVQSQENFQKIQLSHPMVTPMTDPQLRGGLEYQTIPKVQ